jgi:hypothetical protein
MGHIWKVLEWCSDCSRLDVFRMFYSRAAGMGGVPELTILAKRQQKVVTWGCCSGPWSKGVLGEPRHALQQLDVATWRLCSGQGRMAVTGMGAICTVAAREGHLEVLEWARSKV